METPKIAHIGPIPSDHLAREIAKFNDGIIIMEQIRNKPQFKPLGDIAQQDFDRLYNEECDCDEFHVCQACLEEEKQYGICN